MNKFLADTYKFNEYGGTPVDDSYENLMQAVSLIEEELSELKGHLDRYRIANKLDNPDSKDKLKALMLDDITDLKVVANGVLYRMGVNRHIVECAEYVVSDANLSKFPQTIEDACLSVENYESDTRYENVSYKQLDEDRYVVYGNPTGTNNYKILKGVTFEDPQPKHDQLMGVK